MSTPIVINHTGIGVGNSSAAGGLAAGPFDSSFSITCSAHKAGEIDIVNATDIAPKVLALENVVKVRVLMVSVTGNTVKMLLTSSKGTDQAIPLSSGGRQLFHAPTVGDEFTAIKFVGDGSTVSYLLAGETS
jgi:hypothetical protein